MSIARFSTLVAHLTHPIYIDYRGSEIFFLSDTWRRQELNVCVWGGVYFKASTLL